MNYYWFNREEVLQKANENYNSYGVNNKLLNIIRQIKMF